MNAILSIVPGMQSYVYIFIRQFIIVSVPLLVVELELDVLLLLVECERDGT